LEVFGKIKWRNMYEMLEGEKMIQFGNARYCSINLTEGENLILHRREKDIPCQFVRATRKGFNIVDLSIRRYILKSHTYMEGMAGKEFTWFPVKGDFFIPEHIYLSLRRTGKIDRPKSLKPVEMVRPYFNPIMDTLEA
jgi:hypothetical protein